MQKKESRCRRAALAIITGSLLAVLSGCAGQAKVAKGPVFFPPPPNLPRLQYLTGISNSAEVDGDPNVFNLFSQGKQREKKVLKIGKPSGLATFEDKLYLADLTGQLFVIDLPKKTMEPIRGNHGEGKLKKPVGVAVDRGGVVYVADVLRKEVLLYDRNGDYLKSIGTGMGMAPTDVAVDESNLFVLDTRKAVIHVFDPMSGDVLRDIGNTGDSDSSLSLPTRMSLDRQGIIRVSNAGRGDITSYDRDGHFLGKFGKFGDGLGQFSRPKGLSVDADGYVYVVDAGSQNVQVFNDKGRLLTYFGSPKLPLGGMNLPCDIAISSDAIPFYQQFAQSDFELSQVVFVANQFGDPKISLYGVGKRKGVDYEAAYRRSAQERERRAREELQRNRKLAQQASQQASQQGAQQEPKQESAATP